MLMTNKYVSLAGTFLLSFRFQYHSLLAVVIFFMTAPQILDYSLHYPVFSVPQHADELWPTKSPSIKTVPYPCFTTKTTLCHWPLKMLPL